MQICPEFMNAPENGGVNREVRVGAPHLSPTAGSVAAAPQAGSITRIK